MMNPSSQKSFRILLSGASGFVGSRLKPLLQLYGHEVVRLTRREKEEGEEAVYWNPEEGILNKDDFEDFDAVIHLAGAGIVEKRWTKKRKEELFSSRCRDTWLLSQVLSRLYRPPKTLITASAIGYYGDRDQEELSEESAQGHGFLADLCGKWEKATESIENRGTRVVHARFGVVLGAKGGALQKMLVPFRLGLGGKLGSGEQMISWIGIDDALGGLYHILINENITGPVNLVAPQPVTQATFAKTLACKLHRPAFCHLPAWLLRVVFGEMAQEALLVSQNVKPQKLLATGYAFRCPDLQAALNAEISS